MSVKHLFIDTNILVYAHDADAGAKHAVAVRKVAELWDRPYPPAISTQVLHELYVSLAQKGATPRECRKIVDIYFGWEVVSLDLPLFDSSMAQRERFKVSLWDALIIAAAQRAKASSIWSEDLQHGQKFDGVRVENPLLAGEGGF